MISLIVLNYNDYITTSQFVRNMIHTDTIDKIVVVDNHSSDNSYEQLKELCCEKVDLIRTQKNNGYAYGNNFGAFYAIKKYNPQYIIIANPDVELNDDIIEYIIHFAEKTENLGIVTCVMNCTSGIDLPVASKLPDYIDCVLEQLMLLKKIVGSSLKYDDQYLKQKVVDVDVLPGSFFLIEANTFTEVGGFDENTFLYYEENILAHKLKYKGKNNYLLTEKSYIHNHSVTINKNISSVKNRLEIAFDSRKLYCTKYLRCNKLQLWFLKLIFIIGLNDYLLAVKLIETIREKLECE